MAFVTKFDGRKQPFQKDKVVRTCLRMHATPDQARAVANKIDSKIYDGISTKKILQMIFSYLKEFKPAIKHEIDLREAIALLRPKPDFEQFVAMLMREYGYYVETNQIIQGNCVDHEIDAIAKKDSEIVYVEVKHHLQHHTYTGVDVFLETKARFDDLREGYKTGSHKINFNKALVVCNTKISEHARRYSKCADIEHIGWRYPPEHGLEQMIEEKRLYPITLLRGLDSVSEAKLGDAGIILLKQLVETDMEELWKRTRIPRETLKVFVKKAGEVLDSLNKHKELTSKNLNTF